MKDERLVAAACFALICRANHEGSLRERSPLPKKPLLHRIIVSFGPVTHTDLVAGSKTPMQCGFKTACCEMDSKRRGFRIDSHEDSVFSSCENTRGRGFA